MNTSLSEALTPEFPWFHQIPRTIPNCLSFNAFLVVSPILRQASVLFTSTCWVIQEILNCEEGLPDSDGCPPVLLPIGDRETNLNKLDVLPSSAQDSRQSDEARLSLLKVTLVPLASVCYTDPESQISTVMIGKSRKWE